MDKMRCELPVLEGDRDEFEAVLQSRASMYLLLSRLYEKEVDAEVLDAMCSMRFPKHTGNADVDEAFSLFVTYLGNRWERTEEDLRIDYARVFFGNGMNGVEAAYPFESVHTSPDRLMMQDARDEVLALYRAERFEKSERWKDNEDHIALELAFMNILCEKSLRLLREDDGEGAWAALITQRNFLQDHLLNWVSMLVGGMQKFAETDFYRALGQLTFGYLNEDAVFLGELLDDSEDDAPGDEAAELRPLDPEAV